MYMKSSGQLLMCIHHHTDYNVHGILKVCTTIKCITHLKQCQCPITLVVHLVCDVFSEENLNFMYT